MKKRAVLFFLTFYLVYLNVSAQLPDSCKLVIGTNLGGVTDWSTEIPFVNMMKCARTWYTKDADNPNGGEWNTDAADSLSFRTDGYPVFIPQTIPSRRFAQKVATVWGLTDGWEAGKYVVLFDGKGALSFNGCSNLTQTMANRYTFDFNNPAGNLLEMVIDSSEVNDPVRNIRILKIEYENTYQTQPFNPVWLEKLQTFKSVRFMDWGQTNSWGQPDFYTWEDSVLFDWSERSHIDYYTYATGKGIPYEFMIQLMNDYGLNGWVCVPHRANNNYIQNMAQLFHNQLDAELNLTVEYSNEIWNWIFGQTNWLNHYGCEQKGKLWPEGIVPYIQNCLDIWTNVYGNDKSRITRVVGLQTAWPDVSQRIANNMRSGSFDAVAPSYYFGLSSEKLESELDDLGEKASIQDVADRVRKSREQNEKVWLKQIKSQVADPLHVPMVFYEGGQHITPSPFGVEPTYSKALLDIQRDTSMYNLYMEWFDFLRTLQNGNKPLICMNYSFVGGRSAQYGSWGLLETLDQDTSVISAPKFRAILANIHAGCYSVSKINNPDVKDNFEVYPNPACNYIIVKANLSETIESISLTDLSGKMIYQQKNSGNLVKINMSAYTQSVFLLSIKTSNGEKVIYKVIKND